MSPGDAAVKNQRVATLEKQHLTMREVRNMRGLSLRDVELETQIARGTLSKIERGLEMPRPGHMLSICDCLGVHPNDWFAVHEWRCLAESVTP